MIEPRTGVFVGNVSGLVRDGLWDKVCEDAHDGAALMICSARTEQGFRVRKYGDPSREPLECEGLTLIRVPKASGAPRRRRGKEAIPEDEE